MSIKTQVAGILAGFALLMTPIGRAAADCPGAVTQSAGYCLYYADFSAVGKDIRRGNYQVLGANMFPYPETSGVGELAYWREEALADLKAGKEYRDSLLLIGVTPTDDTPLGRLLNHPELNYETAGLLSGFAAQEAGLIQARDTFAYHLYRNYPDEATAKENLLDTVKALANMYLMIADEFLVDALEWRFSEGTVGADPMLDQQIELLEKARIYYERAVEAFVSGFSPAVGTNIYISDYFDDSVYSLFNLSVERLGLALREKSSRQLVRLMAPDPMQQWSDAWRQATETLKSDTVSTYLATAAIAQKRGAGFDDAGEGSTLIGALNALRKQGNIYNQRLNPLGYDNRYVPALNFDNLYALATGNLSAANAAKAQFENEKRLFDANREALDAQLGSLRSQYMANLGAFTGCPIPANPDHPDERLQFIICAGEAGGDLFDCRLDMGVDEFNSCVNNVKTKGSLASKYRNLMDAQLGLNMARLRRDNYLKQIDYENERANRLIQIKKDAVSAHVTLLDNYLPKLKAARTIIDTESRNSGRKWENGKWVKTEKKRDHETSESFKIKDESLDIQTDKEKELLELSTNYEIQQINTDTAYKIKNLLLSEAEAELAIQLAAQQKNSALADFDNLLQEKENLWLLYQRALNQLGYFDAKAAPLRVLRSQAAIELSETMNYTAHYAYLAAKALEYQYVKSLVDVPVASGRLRLTDLFKAQTPSDLSDFLLKLSAINTTECPWGTFNPQYQTISLAYHLLGLTDSYLDPDGDGVADGKTVEQARRERLQAFISEHINAQGHLQFAFTLAENASYLSSSVLYNVKMWTGAPPAACDSLPTPVTGTTVSILTNQTQTIRPKARLKQTGHSSLKDGSGVFHEYIPVYDFHFLLEGTGEYLPSTEAEIISFIGDAREDGRYGTWTGKFKGKSISSPNWEIEIFDWNALYGKTDFGKLTDVRLHIDTIAE